MDLPFQITIWLSESTYPLAYLRSSIDSEYWWIDSSDLLLRGPWQEQGIELEQILCSKKMELSSG
jgi:hypothetical protein